MRLRSMSEEDVARHKEECREVRESGEVSEFAVMAWGERVRELECELADVKRKVGVLEYGRLTVKEDLESVASLMSCAGAAGEGFCSVMFLLLGLAGVLWGDVIICVFGFMLAWLACFLELRRLMRRMNEVRDKLDLVLQGKRVFWVPEVSAAQVWSELHEKHERERRERFRERFMGWLFVLVVLVVFYCYFFT